MPRVHSQKKSRGGKDRSCGRCGRRIEPGETYYKFSFRYGGTHFRCKDHYPKPSELTQSKLSSVYSAIETAEEELSNATSVEDIRTIIEGLADEAGNVRDEYSEAADAMGAAGESGTSREMADELDGWVSDLESFYPDEGDTDKIDALRERAKKELQAEGYSEEDEAEWVSVFEARLEKLMEDEEVEDPLEGVRSEAEELINGCPV